jgi:hypothetical protein
MFKVLNQHAIIYRRDHDSSGVLEVLVFDGAKHMMTPCLVKAPPMAKHVCRFPLVFDQKLLELGLVLF